MNAITRKKKTVEKYLLVFCSELYMQNGTKPCDYYIVTFDWIYKFSIYLSI